MNGARVSRARGHQESVVAIDCAEHINAIGDLEADDPNSLHGISSERARNELVKSRYCHNPRNQNREMRGVETTEGR